MIIQNGISDILKANDKIPVVTFNEIDQVYAVVEKLQSNNVNCIEITLRTDVAWEAIVLCKKITPKEFKVGVGTILDEKQVNRCKDLGVDFLVSPGSSEVLITTMQNSAIPFLPGVMTPSEIVKAMEMNCSYLKLFPFNLAGGLTALKTYSSVFPNVFFCPTGGIDKDNHLEILKMKNVISVGGSWLVS